MSIFDSFQSHSSKSCIILSNNEKLSYFQLNQKIDLFSKNLRAGSLVLVLAQASIEPVICYLAALRERAVIMFADLKTPDLDLQSLIDAYTPDFIFIPKTRMSGIKKYNSDSCITFLGYELLRRSMINKINLHPDLAILLPTSGSTGNTKYVRISHANLEANTKSIIESLGISQKDRAITTMPLGYSYMLSVLNSHLHAGASIFICDYPIIQRKFWELAKMHQITSISGVPTFFHILVRLGLENFDVPSLRQITQAGGKLDNATTQKMIDFAKSKNIEFITMYGQTEASPRISYLDWMSAQRKVGSIGKSIPNVRMWLQAPNGEQVVSPDTEGEIIVAGANVSMGYSESSKDLILGDENQGLLRTGDLAKRDAEGYFYITGRLKRFAKIDGFRLNLDDIEVKMKEVGITIACIEYENQIRVFFEQRLSKNHLLERLAEVTGQNQRIFNIFKLKSFPLTSNGKIEYKALKSLCHD